MIRNKILQLNIITLVPIILFVVYLNFVQLKRSEESAVKEIKNIAHVVTVENNQVIETARQLLVSISVVPEVTNLNKGCPTYLSSLISKYKRYGNFGIADLNGNVICSAIKTDEVINLSDRFFFKETVRTNNYSIGEYVVSRSTGKSSINFGYPLSNNKGVVYATLNLDWLNELVSNLDIDKDVVVTILDKKGVVLARTPDLENLVGKEFPNDPLLKLLNENEGTIETTGLDGKPRIYSYEKIVNQEGQEQYIIAGKAKSDISKSIQKDFYKSIFISAAIITTSLLTGFVVGNSLIAKTVNKLKEIENLRKDFISLVSHQLRTPTTAIKWFAQILLSENMGKINKKQRSILRDTLKSTNRMAGLITTLLDITKLESNTIELDCKATNLLGIVEESLKEIKIIYRNKKIQSKISVNKSFPKFINLDAKLIKQVIINLIDNAFKYNYPSGKVVIELKRNKNKIEIVITDTGIGIPKGEELGLFDKFKRATNAKVVDSHGAGLGLYLSKLIVKAHGGTINTIKSKTKGASFFITIPII